MTDDDASNHLTITAPSTVSANVVWTLPAVDGSSGQVLKTDGSGALGWQTISTSDNTKMPLTGGNFTGNVTFNAQTDIRFADRDSSNWVALQAPATVSSNVTYTLPAAAPTAGQVLKANASTPTNLEWGAAGGAKEDVFYENSRTLSSDYTLATGKNAHSVGPVAINHGVTVTLSAGTRWLVS